MSKATKADLHHFDPDRDSFWSKKYAPTESGDIPGLDYSLINGIWIKRKELK